MLETLLSWYLALLAPRAFPDLLLAMRNTHTILFERDAASVANAALGDFSPG